MCRSEFFCCSASFTYIYIWEVFLMNHDMTTGPVWKKLLLFMLPVFGANLLQALYGTVDLMVVGQFASTADVSAVSTFSAQNVGAGEY